MALHRIERLNLSGDGVADDSTHWPFTLPGERVENQPTGAPRIVEASPDRVDPPCPQFGACGGCSLQHAADVFLSRWKADLVRQALEARGLAAPMRPTVTSPPRSRRRATLAGRRTKKGVTIGFHARGSDRIVPPDGCTLLDPVILALLPFVATITRITASRSGTLAATVTACDSGADIAVTGAKPLDAAMRASLAALAGDAQVARLTVNDETVALHSPPTLRIGPARVALPPGAFLQATRQGEAALQAAVAEAVAPARHIADLFAGCGTFSLPLAAGAAISAVDGDGAMMAALDAAWRGTPGLHAVATQTRDLFRRPLLRGELSAFDAAVIDPPRQGAEAQVAEIAASPLPVVAMVSCNPVTFARDAATLVAAGFHIDWVQPVDQFLWSPHVELAARFSR